MKKISFLAFLALAPLLALPSLVAAQVEDVDVEADVEPMEQTEPALQTQNLDLNRAQGTDMMNRGGTQDMGMMHRDGNRDRDGRDGNNNWNRDNNWSRDNDWNRHNNDWNRGGWDRDWNRGQWHHSRPFAWDRNNWRNYNWGGYNWRHYPTVNNVVSGRVIDKSYHSLLILSDNGRLYLVGAPNARVTDRFGRYSSLYNVREGDRVVVSGVIRNSVIYAARIIDLTSYSYWR